MILGILYVVIICILYLENSPMLQNLLSLATNRTEKILEG